MKKTLLFFSLLLLAGCDNDYYSGDERIVIEGKVVKNGAALPRVNVRVYSSYTEPKNSVISELGTEDSAAYDYSYNQISSIRTDADGKFSLSVPRNENSRTYIVRIGKDQDYKTYGYISDYNVRDYYINLGSLNF